MYFPLLALLIFLPFCFFFWIRRQDLNPQSEFHNLQAVVEAPLTFLITLTFAVFTRRPELWRGDQYTQPGRSYLSDGPSVALPSLRPSSCLCLVIFVCFLFVWFAKTTTTKTQMHDYLYFLFILIVFDGR